MNLPALSFGEFETVFNMFSLTIAVMGAAAFFFILARDQVAPKYRVALVISAVVVAIACYHYVRIFESWNAAFALDSASGNYNPSGKPFNDAYRYADWLAAVPLLLTELVLVLALVREKTNSLILRLVVAAVLMLALGYPGELERENMGLRALWGFLSSIPFAYILWILWGELTRALDKQPARVAHLTRNMRLLLLASWGFYPIAYMFPMFGISGSGAEVAVQVGYSIADILAKPFFGLLLYAIAREKTLAESA